MAPTPTPRDPRIESALIQLRGIPGLFNTQRRGIYNDAQAALLTGNFFEDVSVDEARRADAGITTADGSMLQNLTFRLGLGAEGQVFRNARIGQMRNAASRGVGFGSSESRAQAAHLRDIQRQIAAIQTGASGAQDESLTDQTGAIQDIEGDIAGFTEENRLSEAAREAPVPETPATPDVGPAPAPEIPRIACRGNTMPNLDTLSKRWGIEIKPEHVKRPGGGGKNGKPKFVVLHPLFQG